MLPATLERIDQGDPGKPREKNSQLVFLTSQFADRHGSLHSRYETGNRNPELRLTHRDGARQITPRLLPVENSKISLKQGAPRSRAQTGDLRLVLGICCAPDAYNESKKRLQGSASNAVLDSEESSVDISLSLIQLVSRAAASIRLIPAARRQSI